MGSANAIKKLDAEIKRSKEEVENMDLRRVIYVAKGQLISECLFDFYKFSKKPTKNLTNF